MNSNMSFDVFCDMDDGGWNVIQKRFDGHLHFSRTWSDYKQGFGNLQSEFWLGLDNIYQLTHPNRRLVKFVLEEYSGNFINGTYDGFFIHDKIDKYQLQVGSLQSGNMPSGSFAYNSGYDFATYDNDHNTCASRRHGGWWYGSCTYVNINGKYGLMDDESGVIEHFNDYHNFQATTMKVK